MIIKVLAYIIQDNKILVFRHRDYPEAEIQVPAGTVDSGEKPEISVLREVYEESGLKELEIVRKLGVFEYFHEYKKEWHERHIYLLETKEKLPDEWSHTVSSGTDDRGLVFEYYWLSLDKINTLISSQGQYLD